MCELSAYVAFNNATTGQTDVKHEKGETLSLNVTVEDIPSKFDLCEGGSFSTSIFKSDIQLSVYSFSSFISVCPFAALLKATYAETWHTVLSC